MEVVVCVLVHNTSALKFAHRSRPLISLQTSELAISRLGIRNTEERARGRYSTKRYETHCPQYEFRIFFTNFVPCSSILFPAERRSTQRKADFFCVPRRPGAAN